MLGTTPAGILNVHVAALRSPVPPATSDPAPQSFPPIYMLTPAIEDVDAHHCMIADKVKNLSLPTSVAKGT